MWEGVDKPPLVERTRDESILSEMGCKVLLENQHVLRYRTIL